ncbi:MAG TPA: hypothetical protein VH186_36225 [Chloroflexia bacterium]|nr:hypothetical protein [Chloroflexia bacterium]
MRTILGLLGVAVIAVLAVLGWNWWQANSAQLQITNPTDGATLTGNTVAVRLQADPTLTNRLNQPDSTVRIVTYLDGKEVNRGTSLQFNLVGVAPGQHRMEVGVVEQSSTQNGVSLNIMPRPVNFTLAGGAGANQNSQIPGVSSAQNNPDYSIDQTAPTPTAAPAVPVVPPTPENVRSLPSSGMGGGQNLAAVAPPAVNQAVAAASDNSSSATQAIVVDGSRSQLRVSPTRVNPDAIQAAEVAQQRGSQDNGMQTFFRVMGAFYVAGFIVALGAMFAFSRRRRVK